MPISAEPSDLKLFFEPPERLRLTVADDRSYITVKPAWAAPLTHPNQFLALLDGKENEILTLDDPQVLDQSSWEALSQELRRRYLTSIVTRIDLAKVEFGATYWHVDTDRGPRDFVTQSLQENAQWLGERHLILVDVDGNRFEIPDISALDETSRNFVTSIL